MADDNNFGNIKTYAFIVDNEFACLFRFPSTGNPKIEMLTAALSSNPIVYDVTGSNVPEDGAGWTWDGNKLIQIES